MSDTLQDLQRQFAAKLPGKLEDLLAQYQKLNLSDWQPAEAQALHHLLHSLTGSAGTFGMQSVSAAARQLEIRLKAIVEAGAAPGEDTWAAIGAELTRIEQLAHSRLHAGAPSLKPPQATPHLDPAPLVYLVDDDIEQAEHLASALGDAGYLVRVFTALEDFRAACAEAKRPDAVVLDIIFPEGDSAGIELLQELKAGRERCPPVAFASVRDDLDARLAAYRAGASRYLLKPVAPEALIDLLDALTGRMPLEPYRVLLVDDDPLLLEAQASVLRAAGMVVHALEQPRDTLDTLDSFRPDVVVLDVYMPGVSGPELAAIVRESDEYLSLPILFLSAETDMSQQLLALNLGGDDFLVKPVQPDHLVSAVTARARRVRQNRAVQQRLRTTLYEREREHLALDQHAIVSITDAAGSITYVNDKFCQISGYSRDELLGHNHRIVKSGQHPPEFYRDIWRSIGRGEVWHGEICNRRKDGDLYWVASTITPFLDENGKPYQYVSMRTDITHVKRTEADLRAQNAMREVVGEAAAGLLAAGADTMDAAIEQTLRLVGEHLGAERAYLFQLSADDTRMSNSHEWCAPGIAPQKDDLQDMPREIAPWWWAQIQRDQPVIVPDVVALPPEAAAEKAIFQSLDIPALSGFPIRRGDRTLGFIGFDHQIGVSLESTSLDLLRLLAGQMGSALLRAVGERDVQRQHRFTQDVLDSVSAQIAVLNGDGVIVAVNEPWRRFAIENSEQAGVPVPNTDIGTNYLDVCRQMETADSHDVDSVVAGIESVMTGHAPDFRHEYPCHSPSKSRWFEMTVMPLSGDDGGVVISHVSITERKLAEQAAEAAKERLRRGQMYANIGTWEWNIVTGDLFWTERIAPLFGYPLGDLETSYDNFLAAVHPDDRQAVIDAVNACVERDAPYQIEHRVAWPDGTVRWLLERGAVQRDAAGKPLNMIGVVQDIDDRKRAELDLAERERQLLEAQKVAHLGSFDWNPDSGELSWTDEHFRLWGLAPQSATPSYPLFLQGVHADDVAHLEEALQRALHGGRYYDCVHRVVWPDGSEHSIHGLGEAVFDDAGQAARMTGTVQDVTERVEFEQALVAAREAADRANQAKSEFLSSMSHELRTPMNAILGFGQLMEYDDSLPGEHLDSVQEILKAGQHLLELINEVLDLAKVESGSIDLSLELVEICPVVDECIGLVTPLADRRGIALSHEGLTGAAVRADRMRFKQALLNLLSNAIKYNREGGTVRLDVKPVGADRLRIRVTDTGQGIPAGRLAELFQPFNRLGAEAGEIEGTGIGLTITRRIVEMMGGSVDVDSEVGMGSSFWIELPLEAAGATGGTAGVPVPAGAATTGRDAAASHTVLYIEDNPANLKLVAQILGRVPHIHLLTAHTPSLGIELALARRPELILLDINMPDMDGYQVLEVFKAEASLKAIPVIAITANAMPRDIERGKAAGFTDYLTKPLDVERFHAVVDACLAITGEDHA